MGLLLYKSDEMYSSTELIRKSKMIFNKVLSEEIEKAIILRDGKPSFLLMEFTKYEKIMAEFEELKEYVKSINNTPKKKIKKDSLKKEKKKNIKDKEILKEELIRQSERINIEATDYNHNIETNEESEIVDDSIVENIDDIPEHNEVEELSEEDEIQNALQSIESMNFDDEMKKVAQQKIKDKIMQQRRIRAEQLALEEENKQEEEQEELEMEQQIEEEKVKKNRELKEFWD